MNRLQPELYVAGPVGAKMVQRGVQGCFVLTGGPERHFVDRYLNKGKEKLRIEQ
jgi:hypothetical protein